MTSPTPVLNELLAPVGRCFTREGAERLIGLRAAPRVQSLMDEFALKSNAGTLTKTEREEYESLVSAGTFIAILQAQARQLLNEDELA